MPACCCHNCAVRWRVRARACVVPALSAVLCLVPLIGGIAAPVQRTLCALPELPGQVLTSHDKLGDTGKPTGFWLEELAAPFYVFRDGGAQVTLASPKGGQPPLDPASEGEGFQTAATRRFTADSEASALLAATAKLDSLAAGDYDAIFFPGGHGPMWDLAEDAACKALIEAFWAEGKCVSAVCHGPAVLRHVQIKCPYTGDTKHLVDNKRITAFTNSEEAAVGLTDVVPFSLEDELKSKGADFSKGEDWAPRVCIHGNLITGQNPASSEQTAAEVLRLLSGQPML